MRMLINQTWNKSGVNTKIVDINRKLWCSSNLPKVCKYAQTVRSHPFRSKWKMSKTPLIPLFGDWTVSHWMCFCLWTNDFICYRFNVVHFSQNQQLRMKQQIAYEKKELLDHGYCVIFGCLRYTYLIFAGDNVIANRFQYDSWWVVLFKEKKNNNRVNKWRQTLLCFRPAELISTMEFDLFDFSTHF